MGPTLLSSLPRDKALSLNSVLLPPASDVSLSPSASVSLCKKNLRPTAVRVKCSTLKLWPGVRHCRLEWNAGIEDRSGV